MSEREAILRDLTERARFYASLTSIGIPRCRLPETATATAASITSREAPSTAPAEELKAIRDFIGDCQRCKLAGGRKNIVFGQGNPHAALMFVGEAPGPTKTSRVWRSWAGPASSSRTSSRRA